MTKLCEIRYCPRDVVATIAGLDVCNAHAKLWYRKQSFANTRGPSTQSALKDARNLAMLDRLCEETIPFGSATEVLSRTEIVRLLQREWLEVTRENEKVVLRISAEGKRELEREYAYQRLTNPQVKDFTEGGGGS